LNPERKSEFVCSLCSLPGGCTIPVDNATLTRFFALHFLIPFAIAAITINHLLFTNQRGSNNPLGLNKNTDKMQFHQYFTGKYILKFAVIIILLSIPTPSEPYILGGPDNFTPAYPLASPVHIQPE
jgi:ubiquinol-cytochrome c reductase cytochrome b subunit